ncbi:MAG TPA: hypothetical protein VF796_11835 [Humisphaera sp.]
MGILPGVKIQLLAKDRVALVTFSPAEYGLSVADVIFRLAAVPGVVDRYRLVLRVVAE